MTMRVGEGDYQYDLVDGWGELPAGITFSEVAAVAVDSKDRVYAFHRGRHPVVIFDSDGKYLSSWGDDFLQEAHGMYIDGSDHLYLVDRGSHTVEKCTVDGARLLTIGKRDQPAPEFSNKPFNMPQGAATGSDGCIYVADGKLNNAVHKFRADGTYVKSWGHPGAGRGEFKEPHGIWIRDDGVVIVADRGNDRLQFFDTEGNFLWAWGTETIHHPDHLFIDHAGILYVTELEYHRVSVLTPEGQLLCRWGGGPGVQEGRLAGSKAPGKFDSPHGIWCDSKGSIYISEVRGGRRVVKYERVLR